VSRFAMVSMLVPTVGPVQPTAASRPIMTFEARSHGATSPWSVVAPDSVLAGGAIEFDRGPV
jgi:hypothetical protein